MHQAAAKLPAHAESRRLSALRSYGILDTPAEAVFEDITRIAAAVCGTPISVVNLIDADRQWFKSEIGLGVRETPLETSICAHAILEQDFLEVPDTTIDPRFASNPLVTGDPNLRFYAGALLKTPDGLPLGTVCVLDTVPRALTQVQIVTLQALARQVMAQLELRRMLVEAQALNQHRARVLATAGHDLKGPLRAALYALGKARAADETDRDARLESAAQDLAYINQKFGDMIAGATGKGGAAAPELRATDLAPVLEDAARVWARAARRKQIDLVVEGAPCVASSDAALLETLIGNLVSNAIKYTADGGRVSVSCSGRDASVDIVVADTGIGMDASRVEDYFSAFRQADAASEGLGIGLWIVRQAAEALDARVDVASALGAGTRVTVSLPRV
ncbi:GAF domain-containing sensor histidine kinase [Luteimonas sp. 3794]|uniref:GAF domain-containing sensor histidine kinase n=1 Tax=Luteimonas sp. 3794 TaxID=2817730 RepID=UPI00285AE082|nr:GAF domain-containing sensor histidine kinase [Luteimonas sp. 3794]MDR6992930.1 signal transduction histidine kinase [Luteimonas sp. 3794]